MKTAGLIVVLWISFLVMLGIASSGLPKSKVVLIIVAFSGALVCWLEIVKAWP